MTIASGTNLGPFRIVAPLGRGGMATVYRAYEPGLNREVAIKVLPAEFLHDPAFAERFRHEAQHLAQLEHPNIIPIYAYGIDDGMPWMSMRLISEGGALSTLLKGGGPLPPPRFLQVLRGVADALDYAHAKGVVHRDVKPQNVLIDGRHHVYLADFGLAKMMEGGPGLTKTGMITGTPEYMAPEQALGSVLDHRADIYSLGVVAYVCLTGRVPFTADTPLAVLMKHVREPIPLPSLEEVPEPVMHTLLKALAKTPSERWASAGAFVEALHQASPAPTLLMPASPGASTMASARSQGSGPATSASGSSTPARSTAWALPALIGLAVVVAASALGVFAAWRVLRPSHSPEAAARPSGSNGAPTLAIAPSGAPSATLPTSPPSGVPTRARTSRPASSEPPNVSRPGPAPAASGGTSPSAPKPRPGEGAEPLPALAAPPVASLAPAPSLSTASSSGKPAAAEPAGIPFALDANIPLGDATRGLVSLQTVRFRFDRKRSELSAEVEGECRKGHDQEAEIQLELLDGTGQTLEWLKGKSTIEEGDRGTVKAKQRLSEAKLESVAAFRLTFQTRND